MYNIREAIAKERFKVYWEGSRDASHESPTMSPLPYVSPTPKWNDVHPDVREEWMNEKGTSDLVALFKDSKV